MQQAESRQEFVCFLTILDCSQDCSSDRAVVGESAVDVSAVTEYVVDVVEVVIAHCNLNL